MRLLATLLLCLTTLSCSSMFISGDDLELYCNSRVFKPLILPKEISDAHPRIYKQLLKAIDRWELSVPVDFKIYEGMTGPRNSISIGIGEYINPFIPNLILGFYNPDMHVLFINDCLEKDAEAFSDDAIYKTCLHELGHVMGIPHIIGRDLSDMGGGFDIVLPSDEDAKKCIMYPVSSDADQTDLSPVEILWARHALMHDLNLSSFLGMCNYEKNGPRLF